MRKKTKWGRGGSAVNLEYDWTREGYGSHDPPGQSASIRRTSRA